MVSLNRFRITARIYSGFGVLVALGLALALFAIWQFAATGGQVGSLVTTADHTARIIKVTRLLETVNRAGLRYQTKGDEAMVKEFSDAHAQVSDLLALSVKDALSEERRRTYQEMTGTLVAFKGEFEQLVQLSNAVRTSTAALSKIGGEVVGATSQAVKLGRASDDTAVNAAVRDLEVAVLTARLTSARFSIFKTADIIDQFHAAVGAVDKALAAASAVAADPALAQSIAQAKTSFAAYAKTTAEMADAVLKSEQLYEKTMAPQIATMQQQLAMAETSMVSDFHGTTAATEAKLATASLLQEIAAAGALLLGVALAYVIGRSIAGPVTAMTGVMRRLADGDKSVEIPSGNGKDEIAAMAQAVEIFQQNMIRADDLAAEQRAEQARKEARQATVERHIEKFESIVRASLGTLAESASEMRATSQSMSTTAQETSAKATTVAVAAEQASANVQTVATAAEELSSSVAEIGRQVGESTKIAGQAVAEANRTNVSVQGLSAAAQKIGDVVKLISDIASQTNLLALNATIEAARAGDAGKGFAVVASEVKSLANQTAKATEEISAQVAAMQGATGEAVQAIQGIGGTIGAINEIATTIASAVEEQGAATQEIARNVQEASKGTGQVTSNIAGVNEAAAMAGTAAGQVLTASDALGQQAETLRSDVDDFLAKIRAA
jgi:methyl-accepting chemotaxis protein